MAKKRPYEHRKVQKEVKDIEMYQCIVCNMVDAKAHGHHLIPYREGGAANLQNMVTMCPDCHRRYHAGTLNIDIERF
ncbi:HNH endonuclease [Spirulina major]|uniref:HNH endonuclease n=1 Tax=Spirulina major TaxID=270636 RepID=UPI0009324DA6|nr:HNH endonuclease [Spirulina major]